MSHDKEDAEEVRRELQIKRLVTIQPFNWQWWAGFILLIIGLIVLAGAYYLAIANSALSHGEVMGFLVGGTLIFLAYCGMFVYVTVASSSKLRKLKQTRTGAKVIAFRRRPQ